MENKCSDPMLLLHASPGTCITWHLHHLARYECLFDNRFAMGIVSFWGGAYPFAEKPKYHFLPPKIPTIFPKTSPCPYI